MRIPRFYCPAPISPQSPVILEGQTARHIGRVLRMKAGDALVLFDGHGGEYPGTVDQVEKQQVVVIAGQHVDREVESPCAVTLGIAISRGERMDHVVQKATELGVAGIAPLFTARTEVRLNAERAAKKREHWQQVVISACEQCGRNRVPAVAAPTGLDKWLAGVQAERKLVLHHRTSDGLAAVAMCASAALLVGPEGGLEPAEIDRALAQGFEALALGPRVLRTETAPLVALTLLQSRWGDLSN